MATEIVEYRPGKWVKVVDGRITGRATPEEVAAWQEAARSRAPAALDIDLDIDLSPGAAAGPARALDVSRRPAFERRGRPVPAKSPKAPAVAAGDAPTGPKKVQAAKPTAPATPERTQAAGPSVPSNPQPASRRPADEAPQRAAPKPGAAAVEEPEPPPARSERGPGYWWIWNSQRQPVEAFLSVWVPRYKEKFGHEATIILCHEDDLAAVEACGYNAQISPLLQPGHFYLGHDDGA